jgi:hypothetical protein
MQGDTIWASTGYGAFGDDLVGAARAVSAGATDSRPLRRIGQRCQ